MSIKKQYLKSKDRCKVSFRVPKAAAPGAKTVHIGAPALEVLSEIERIPENPWVITGTRPKANLTDLQLSQALLKELPAEVTTARGACP